MSVTFYGDWNKAHAFFAQFYKEDILDNGLGVKLLFLMSRIHKELRKGISNIRTSGFPDISGSPNNPTSSLGGGTVGRRTRYIGGKRIAQIKQARSMVATKKYLNNIIMQAEKPQPERLSLLITPNKKIKEVYRTMEGKVHNYPITKLAYLLENGDVKGRIPKRPIWKKISSQIETFGEFKDITNFSWIGKKYKKVNWKVINDRVLNTEI